MIDELDRTLLNILILNGRASARTIVKKLEEKGIRMSERGVGKRIAKLERDKVILGYTTILDMEKVGISVPRLVTLKLSSPKNFVQRLTDMKEYLAEAPFCDFSARSNGDIDWIEIKLFNNLEQANKEADLYRTWFGDIIEDYRSYDLDVYKFGWKLFDEPEFEEFVKRRHKIEGTSPVKSVQRIRSVLT